MTLLILSPTLHALYAQTGNITGKIVSTDGKPASFVSISLKEIRKGTTSAEDGRFMLKNIKHGNYTLAVSHAGLQSQEKQVWVSANQTFALNFVLRETADQLAELVINGRKSANARALSSGKISIAPMDLPQSVSVIGQSVIRDQQVMRLSDVIKNVNGVYLATTRGSTQESFSARGYGFSSSNMFKNGSRVNSGAMPEVSSLERVEILKGSAAILYGNVAPGGIINMITKQPKFERGGELAVRLGSYNLIKPSMDIYGPINSKVAYRVNGSYENSESFRNGVSSERFYVNPSLLFKLSKHVELLVQADYLKHKFTPDFGIGSLDNVNIAPLSRSTFLGASWSKANTRQTTASALLKHRLGENWQINYSASYQQYKRDYYSTERIQASADGTWARPLGRTNTAEDYVIGQVDVTGKFKTGILEHTLLTGVDADRYYTSNYTFNQPAIYDTINILNINRYKPRTDIPEASRIRVVKTPVVRMGAYVQDLVNLSAKFKLLAGVRWSYQESEPAKITNLVTHVQTKGVSKVDKAFSPRIGLIYKPIPMTALFSSYANSFSVNSGTDVSGNALAPSIIDQFEIGVKNDFFKGMLSANLTFYRIINNNLAQTARFTSDGITPNNNTNVKELTGQTTSDGFELDLTSRPVNCLDIMAGYSYNYMRYSKTPDAKGNYIEGERLVNTPAHTANASMFYTFGSGKIKGLKIGAAAFYVGDRFGGWNNTIRQVQQYSRLIAVPGFSTMDISAGYTFRKVSVLAKVSNLTNTFNYYVHENYSINPIAPRQVIGTLSYRF
ncbi:MAG: TonB-dependent receptor [Chitinophagaceae bacterium]